MRHWILPLMVVGLLMLTMVSVGWTDDDGEPAPCADCHDEIAAALGRTPHGLTQRGAPACTDCHGDGVAHMENGDEILIPTGVVSQQVCRTCHSDSQRASATVAAHASAGIDCTTCHDIHPDGQASLFLLKKQTPTLCASCHTSKAKSFDRPFGHKLDQAVDCVSCHDPHGPRGRRNLWVGPTGDGPCMSCHPEKLGPFVFPHVSGVAGDCMSCHEPHGSSFNMALTRPTVHQLCVECHSPTLGGGTLGSQAVSTHDLLGSRFRNCTTCHVAVHGSNLSPRLLK